MGSERRHQGINAKASWRELLTRLCVGLAGRRLLGVALVLGLGGWTGCGGSQESYVHTGPPAQAEAVLKGQVTFERLLPQTNLDRDTRGGQPARLDFTNPAAQPVRFARLELLDEQDQVVDEGHTDEIGRYQLEASAGPGRVRLRVYAETVAVPGKSGPISVRDNTQGRVVYAVESEPFDRVPLQVDLEIPSGYDSSGRQPGPTRPSAPFACLDGILTGYGYLLGAGMDPSGLPVCKVNWSSRNRPEPGDLSDGQVQTSHFSHGDSELYILGFAEADTDEFDWHIMIHEFGHWIQDHRFRSDRAGGEHSIGDSKDPRLAFSEGFGNAIGGLALGDPVYKDTAVPDGFAFSLECNGMASGWFSEASVMAILFDLFDPVRVEGGDSSFDDRLQLRPAQLVEALNFQAKSSALTTIFSFLHGLTTTGLSDSETEALHALLSKESPTPSHGINSLDEFAVGETHDGGVYPMPLYTDLTAAIGGPSVPLTVGGQLSVGAVNWLSGVRF